MQKVAVTCKFDDIDTKIAFVSQMSDYFLKKIFLNWNTLTISYFKTQPR